MCRCGRPRRLVRPVEGGPCNPTVPRCLVLQPLWIDEVKTRARLGTRFEYPEWRGRTVEWMSNTVGMLKRSSIHRHTFGQYVGRLASADVGVERGGGVESLTDDYLARMKAFGKVVLHGRVDGRRSGWSE
jgi:hypothetical protein